MCDNSINSKLELSKKKILSRKYGYMFYKKAISPLLPSQVEKLYELNRKKRTYIAWKSLWFDERAGWRLAIRANLHYVYALKRSAFKKWQLRIMQKKTKKIQMKIASTYYTKKCKVRALRELVYYAKCYKHIETLRKILIEQFVLRYSTLEVIQIHYKCIGIVLKYCLKEFACNKTKRKCFNKLSCYANEEIHKKNNLMRARLLFKSKNYPEMLRPFLTEWRQRAVKSASNKFKLHLATEHINNKILNRCLHKLYDYLNYRRTKHNNKVFAKDIYETNLKAKCLKCLREFIVSRINKRIKMETARDFYAWRITRECFGLLVRYKNYARRKKDTMLKTAAHLERKLKKKTVEKLKKYNVACKKKKAKLQIAVKHHESKIKRACLQKCLIFSREQKATNNKKINTITMKSEKRLLRNCFSSWKLFHCLKLQKRIKISLAVRVYEAKLTSKSFIAVRQYIKQRKTREITLVKFTVTKWKDFVEYQNFYRSKLQKAQLIYKQHLIKKGINAILTAAYKKQDRRKHRVLEIVEYQLVLARKYFTIWRRKATPNEKHRVDSGRKNLCNEIPRMMESKLECKEVDELVMCSKPFVWNNLCFEKPKIPTYLRESIIPI